MEWIKTVLNAVRVAVQNVETGCTRAIEALKASVVQLESTSEKTVKNLSTLSSTVKSTNDTVKDISDIISETRTELNHKITMPTYDGGRGGYNGSMLVYTRNGVRWYPQRAIITVSSWEEVQKTVRSGMAEKMYRIGDQFICYHSTLGQIIWDIIGFDIDTPADTTYAHSMTLQSHFCPYFELHFDVAEPTNPDSNIKNYGSSDWTTSDMRQWLNSDADVGAWWVGKTGYDVAPPNAASTPGFMHGLPEEFIKVIGAVSKSSRRYKKSTSGGTITEWVTNRDFFFLLSLSEINAGTYYGAHEGAVYPFYQQFTDNNGHADSDIALIGYDAIRCKSRRWNDTGTKWMLRSPHQTSTYRVCQVDERGNITETYARSTYGIAPACCIV